MYKKRLSDGDYVDGDVMSPTQIMADHIVSETYFVTISGPDHEMFYYDKKARIWRENGEDFIWRMMAQRYPTHTKAMLNEVLHFIQGQTLLPREKFVSPKYWLNFENQGTDAKLNYSQEMVGPHHYFRNKFPVRYVAGAQCPNFTNFLREVLPEFEDRITLLECMAMVLVPQFNFEKAVMFIGKTSANGKSTIMKVMRKLFGDINTVSISLQDLIYDRFMGQRLDGKLLNIYADINAKQIKDLDKFKLFISGDMVTVQRKNGHPYEIIPVTKHFFSTNTLPEIEEDNTAVYRRFIIIDFPKSFEDCRDLDLLDKLTTKEELEGIMWYLIKIAKNISRQRKFTFEQSPEEIRMRWKNESNAVFEFIEHSGLISKSETSRITHQEFYSYYAKFCKQKHYVVKSTSAVTRQIKKLGYMSQKSNGEQFWLGLDIPRREEGQGTL